MSVTLEILLRESTSLLNRILVSRRDDDDKQPRFQQAWFLGLIAGSDEVIALHPDGVQRHHGEWRVSPMDDPESNLRELKSALALMTECDWRTPGCKTDDARDDHESKRHISSDDTVPMAQEPSSGSGVKRSNIEAIRRADAEAEKAVKRAKMLEERRAAKRASATPMDVLEESATNAETSTEAMLIAAEAVLTETRETIEALTVSALQQAHEMSHRPETTAESFFQAHKDMTVTSKEQARQKQLDFLESMKVFEEAYEDELPARTHVMSGRWVGTMKTPTMWRSKYSARGYEEPHSDEGCFAVTPKIQGIRMLKERCLDKRDQGHEDFVADYTQAFLNAEVREGEQLDAQPPEGWNPKILMDGRRVVWKVRKAMLGLRTSPRRWQEHLSSKLKEHGFVQDERDPCLFANTELDMCIGVHVDDMLAVGPSE